jgi:hypothetical protein
MTLDGAGRRNMYYVPQGNNKTLFQITLYPNGEIFIYFPLNPE